MKGEPSTIYLTYKERILLHLLNYSDFTSQTNIPNAIIQQGIADAIWVRSSHIPQAIKDLKKNGLVNESKGYVTGIKRRRKAYSLTLKGIIEAQKIKESIENKSIFIKDFKDKLKKVKLSEVPKYIKDNKSSYLEILRYTSLNGILNIKTARKKIFEQRQKYIDYAKKIPKLKYFFDRTHEIEIISDYLESDKPKIIIIKGIAGIGKTTLITKLISDYKKKRNVFWYRIRSWSSLKDIVRQLSIFMSKMGKNKLNVYINSKQTIDLIDILTLLELDLNNTDSILVFDDIHTAKGNIQEFFSALLDILENISSVKFIIMGRYIPNFYNRKDVKIKKMVYELELGGLDDDGSLELRKARKLDYLEFKKIFELTKGHPLFLELIKSVENKEINSDLQEYIHEEIYTKLDEKEKKLLEIISVFRHPVEANAFFISNDLKYETLDKMIKKSLVQVGIHGKYDLHDCIREFFYNRLTPKIRKEYHKKIALFYLEEKDELSYIEAEYHYCKAEEYKNAMSLIIKNGNKPIKKGYLEEFMPILNEFDEKKVTPQHWAKILMFKGDINYQKSNWDEALIYYHSTLKISKKLRDNMKIAESYLKIGHVEEAQSKWDSAAENFNKVLKISKKINDLNGIIEGNLGLGKIYFRKGEFNKAIFCLNKALKENKKINDSYRESKIFMELGNINGEKGEYDKAIEFYNKSLKIFKELKNKFEIVRAYNNISTTYTYKWEWDKAIEYSKKQIILAEEIGDIRGLAHGFNALAYDYLQIGNLKEATQYWEKATQLINKFGEKILLAVTLEIHACILWKKKEWNKALEQFNESIDTFKEIGYFGFGFGNACYHSGLMQKEKGDFKAAKQKLRKALKTFKKLGNNQMIKKVESELTVL